jgi:hypothetical protein
MPAGAILALGWTDTFLYLGLPESRVGGLAKALKSTWGAFGWQQVAISLTSQSTADAS